MECYRCHREKPKKEFYKKNTTREYNSHVTDYTNCKACRSKRSKEYKDKINGTT